MCMVTRRLCTLLDLHTSKNQEQVQKKKKRDTQYLTAGTGQRPKLDVHEHASQTVAVCWHTHFLQD